mgnify:CR=1 FL=1
MLYTKKPQKFSPKFSVVSCFIENKGEFLLLRRQDEKPEGNTWGMPAGKIEQGENLLEAVIREIKEETSLVIEKPKLKYFKELFVRYPNYDFVYHIFSTNFNKRPKVIINDKEHKKYYWFKPEEALLIEGIEDLDKCIEIFYSL